MARSVHYGNADHDTFNKTTSNSDRITIVDFYAQWCGPCRTLTPILEKLTAEPSKTKTGLPLDLVKIDIDTDDGRRLAERFKVTGVPTVIAFKDTVPVAQFLGVRSPALVKEFLEDLV